MRRILFWIDALLLKLVIVLFTGFFVCVLLQVFYRYVLKLSLPWSEEVARYLFVWSSLIAAAVVVGQNDHFSIPLFVEKLPDRPRLIIDAFGTVLCIVFAVIVIANGTSWSWRMLDTMSSYIQVSQGLIYSIVPLAALYMAIHLLVRLKTTISTFTGGC